MEKNYMQCFYNLHALFTAGIVTVKLSARAFFTADYINMSSDSDRTLFVI